jgi:hypothetical protein
MYSVKELKHEFSILNRLFGLTKHGKLERGIGGIQMDTIDNGIAKRRTRDGGQGAAYEAYIQSA